MTALKYQGSSNYRKHLSLLKLVSKGRTFELVKLSNSEEELCRAKIQTPEEGALAGWCCCLSLVER